MGPINARRVPLASSSPSAKAESLPLAEFYSGQQPDNPAASVVDYYSGVLRRRFSGVNGATSMAIGFRPTQYPLPQTGPDSGAAGFEPIMPKNRGPDHLSKLAPSRYFINASYRYHRASFPLAHHRDGVRHVLRPPPPTGGLCCVYPLRRRRPQSRPCTMLFHLPKSH